MTIIKSVSYVDSRGKLFMDVIYNAGDRVIEKRIGIEDYISLFTENVVQREKEKFIAVPQIPEEVKKICISSKRENTFKAVVLYPEKKRPFSFEGIPMVIPYPALLAYIYVKDGCSRELRIFALKTDAPGQEEILMEYPFGNCRSSGETCMGNILVEGIKDGSEALRVLDAFLMGTTNNDLYHSQNTAGLSQGALIELIKKKNKFPKKLLVKASCRGIETYGGLLDRCPFL